MHHQYSGNNPNIITKNLVFMYYRKDMNKPCELLISNKDKYVIFDYDCRKNLLYIEGAMGFGTLTFKWIKYKCLDSTNTKMKNNIFLVSKDERIIEYKFDTSLWVYTYTIHSIRIDGEYKTVYPKLSTNFIKNGEFMNFEYKLSSMNLQDRDYSIGFIKKYIKDHTTAQIKDMELLAKCYNLYNEYFDVFSIINIKFELEY